jgi:flagellar hook-length control protein FliK
MKVANTPLQSVAPQALNATLPPNETAQREAAFANVLRQTQATAGLAKPATTAAPTPPRDQAQPTEAESANEVCAAPGAPASANPSPLKAKPKVPDKPNSSTATQAQAAQPEAVLPPAAEKATQPHDDMSLQHALNTLPSTPLQQPAACAEPPRIELKPMDGAHHKASPGPEVLQAVQAQMLQAQAAELEATPQTLAPAAAQAAAFVAELGALTAQPSLRETTSSAAPVAVEVPTPLSSPDFAQTLGVQLSMLARDGIERAELQLNPADMGPVSVYIVIEGTQARVDFLADVAATRQVLEAGLPQLASALHDAGFTLSGGGVSQHAPERNPHASHAQNGTPRDAGPADEDQPPVQRRTVSAGGVDLYA